MFYNQEGIYKTQFSSSKTIQSKSRIINQFMLPRFYQHQNRQAFTQSQYYQIKTQTKLLKINEALL